jgi:hypothetical protein
MSDYFQTNRPDPPDIRIRDIATPSPALPAWLASRVLRPDEELSWVFGPTFNPPWERHVTNPVLFLQALAIGLMCATVIILLAAGDPRAVVAALVCGGGIVIGVIMVLGICSGYWTRLVVTDARLIVLQGYEVVKSWNIDNLPVSLRRYGKRKDGREAWSIDLDTVSTMLGASSGKAVDQKSILVFAKQVDRIRSREPDRTREFPESRDDTQPPGIP